MPEEITEKAGAVPVDKGKEPESLSGKQGKEETSDSSPEMVMDKDGKPLPWDQQPKWKEARASAKKLSDLLKANDLEDPDDLVDLVQKGKVVKGKLSDLNQLDSLMEKAERLDKYEAYWRDQEERQRREVEDPSQTIARLEHALRQKNIAEQTKEKQQADVEHAKQAISSYEREVSSLVKEVVESKDQQGFVLEFFGVGNPANDIDITDRKAIKKLIEDGIKKKNAYDQAIIQAYIKGKIEIPKMSSSSTAPTSETKPKIMLKDARKLFSEHMKKTLGG